MRAAIAGLVALAFLAGTLSPQPNTEAESDGFGTLPESRIPWSAKETHEHDGWIATWDCTQFGCQLGLVAIPVPVPEPVLIVPWEPTGLRGKVTHYGVSYEGGWLGCGMYQNWAGDNLYHTADTSIVATRDFDYPCGTRFRITGPGGTIIAFRQDTCPGCDGPHHLDLSEGGSIAVCGSYPHTCYPTIEVLW